MTQQAPLDPWPSTDSLLLLVAILVLIFACSALSGEIPLVDLPTWGNEEPTGPSGALFPNVPTTEISKTRNP